MTVSPLTHEDGRLYGLFVDEASFPRLCHCISQVPGVVFTDRRWFFWFSDSIRAEFTFKGIRFGVEPNSDFNYISVVPRQEVAASHEIEEIRDHIEQHYSDRRNLIRRFSERFT